MAETEKENLDKISQTQEIPSVGSAVKPSQSHTPPTLASASASTLSSPMAGSGSFGYEVKKEKKPALTTPGRGFDVRRASY